MAARLFPHALHLLSQRLEEDDGISVAARIHERLRLGNYIG